MREAMAAFALFVLLGCGATARNPGTPGDSTTDTEDDGTGGTGTTTPDDSAGFSITTGSNGRSTYPIHKDPTDFDEPCVAGDGEQIDCYVEAEELDLFYNGLSLNYNVPSTQCDYFRYIPYYYFLREAGTGPTTIQLDTGSNGATGIDTDSDGTIDGPTTLGCQYDYSATTDRINCCSGDYTFVRRNWAAGGGYNVATTFSNWGGKASNCYRGPAMDTQQITESGAPMASLTYVSGIGLRSTYQIEAPMLKQLESNIYVANYFELADHGGSEPAAMVNPYYDFQCLDRTKELKSQIRVIVREWNTDAAFLARVAAPANHSLTGLEVWAIAGFLINDYIDWKDLGNAFPGALH